ncbi:MAG: glycosyltransferase [Candidatus Omnitrophica bacterium]|nr:glycosyltransferase [Candidatus Omnitrophota bacterium]
MFKNKDIVCISSIDWDFIWQGHQEIMSSLARDGNRVLFIENTGARAAGIKDITRIIKRVKNWFAGVEGIREVEENLFVFSPILLPFPYLRFAQWVNRHLILSILEKWFKIMSFTNPIVWAFLPTPLTLDIIDNLNYRLVIYYCIDNFRVSSAAAKKIKNSEIKLLKKADLVFVTSKALYNYCSQYNDRIYNFPFAVNFQQFQEIRLKKYPPPAEMEKINRPVIGYVGGIHKWLDLHLIKEAATNYPQYSFVFIGPVQADVSLLANLKNIYFLGAKNHGQLPDFINNFDVCLIPYLITDYTNNVYPTKLNEYHALGKPVVSTALPEVIDFNQENDRLVFIGRNYQEFISHISNALNDSGDNLIEKRIACAKRNSWAARIREMENLVEDIIKKKSRMPIDWRTSLGRIYRNWRRKTLKIFSVCFITYLLVFYTPLVWFLAAPLKISEHPRKVDAIVVFAGGVGESGKASQGYEERVQQAVNLYRQGYAKYLFFSSGYTHVFEESLLMKALAVSLGVPEDRVILEDKARNTYENVKFTKIFLNKNGWNSIILVSSPYHMLRASLVFGKIANNIKVVYAPVANNSFYAHPSRDGEGRRILRRISLLQIKGVIHEYLGILYYWSKGWI